jgi:hypothetical protein
VIADATSVIVHFRFVVQLVDAVHVLLAHVYKLLGHRASNNTQDRRTVLLFRLLFRVLGIVRTIPVNEDRFIMTIRLYGVLVVILNARRRLYTFRVACSGSLFDVLFSWIGRHDDRYGEEYLASSDTRPGLPGVREEKSGKIRRRSGRGEWHLHRIHGISPGGGLLDNIFW